MQRAPWLVRALSLIAGLLAGAASAPARSPASDTPAVAAAADLQFALVEVADAFRRETGKQVKLTFGSSGNFTRQIRQGAPYEMFFSADEAFVVDLARGGFARDEGSLYAVGRIVLIVRRGSPLKAEGDLADLKAALGDGRLKKFAIASPQHAPYGRRAEEALRHAGLWEAIKDKLVLGENVAQAAQFATSGNAQGGIIAYSLALSPSVSALGAHSLIPEAWHQPLRQRVALLKNSGPTAQHFYAFVQEKAARAILRRFGFVLPGEGS
jgi:molybdate transport system substrate-binding protein